MRYITRIAKLMAGAVATFWALVVTAPAALADHGSAWTLQRGVPPSGGGTSLGAWIIFGVLLVAIVYAAVRMAMQSRARRAREAVAGESGTVATTQPKAA